MADGDKKPFQKTFGDVMKGTPSGAGGRRERPGKSGQAGEGRRERPEAKTKAAPERKGPVVLRKPAPLASGAASPAEPGTPSPVETPIEPERREPTEPRRGAAPEVFRRAESAPQPTPIAIPEFVDEPPAPGESFAELFAESERVSTPRRFDIGQKVAGQIVKVGKDTVFLDLGGKGEATIPLAELVDEEGKLAVPPSGVVEGFILALSGGIVVTKQLTKGAQTDYLAEARNSGIPVEGLVSGVNKGGLEVELGGIRGFCPVSQIANHFIENPAELVGQRLSFRVTDLKDRDVVLSRRVLMEEEAAAKAKALREKLAVGVRLEGRVTRLQPFGAFVDLGGLEGLLHVSELGHARIADPGELLQVGQSVTVEVIRIDSPKAGEQREKIALSMKALQQDPWTMAAETLRVDERRTGRVVRLQPFGAFVELMPGIDGLVHISALGAPKRIAHPREIVNEGDEVTVVIEAIDPAQKRISLRRVTPEELLAPEGEPIEAEREARGDRPVTVPVAPAAQPRVGDVFDVTVDKVETFGLFVKFGQQRGLIPNVEMGTHKGADHRKMFPVGTVFKAAVIEIDAQGRLKLSKVKAEQAEERAEYTKFLSSEKQRAGGGKGFGTLGDLLKLKK